MGNTAITLCTNTEPLHPTPETNIMLQSNYTSIKKKKNCSCILVVSPVLCFGSPTCLVTEEYMKVFPSYRWHNQEGRSLDRLWCSGLTSSGCPQLQQASSRSHHCIHSVGAWARLQPLTPPLLVSGRSVTSRTCPTSYCTKWSLTFSSISTP